MGLQGHHRMVHALNGTIKILDMIQYFGERGSYTRQLTVGSFVQTQTLQMVDLWTLAFVTHDQLTRPATSKTLVLVNTSETLLHTALSLLLR